MRCLPEPRLAMEAARIAVTVHAVNLMHAAHVPAGDGPFPTIVALHGWGANAHDLLGLAPYLHGGRALVLCPQGPVAFQVGQGVVGYGWYPIVATGGRPADPAEVMKGLDALQGFLDAALARYPADPSKLVLLGFSQGGHMAYQLGLRDPARWAGLVALSSWIPEVLPRLPGHARLPTLVIHGSKDPMVPVERAHAARDALLSLGVPTVFREYPMGHEIRPEALRDVVAWLEEKVLTPIALA
jgi:phospholipase/carboxylesterase